MANDQHRSRELAARLTASHSLEDLAGRLQARPGCPQPNLGGSAQSPEALDRRWQAIAQPGLRQRLALTQAPESYAASIEHLIGAVELPLGLAGPLRVNGSSAHGDYWLPLATHEAALVASYHRGCQVIAEAGGCSTLLLAEGVTRSPGFCFDGVAQAGRFVAWALEQEDAFRAAAASTTRHGRLTGMRVSVEGDHVYLLFDFTTGDAAGQNMVTIATQAICADILARCPVQPRRWYIEANASGDKKASAQSFSTVRGRKVTAEVLIPDAVVQARLHAPAADLVEYWRMSALGGVISGTIGVQGHYANGLAALFIATGQDAACVAEAAVGVTRFELRDGALYAAVTLPNLIVGTVGGGTGLPSQRACLELMELAGDGNAGALAEVCAGCSLAGELSIIGALASGEFVRAHERLARVRRRKLDRG
ncbi:MAG: 3-hydroxy-3-methylglutaryl-CoA reductase [Planctomycetota bacterium]|nr:MAG: 3-hydroxy-3-methylglutaryl-CoA reductase [Planctomycetota bacterium]